MGERICELKKKLIFFFSDKSLFALNPDNRRIFIWRECSTRNNSAFAHESIRFDGEEVVVCVGISIDACTDLGMIRNRALTGRRCRDEIPRPIVVPYVAAIRDGFILIVDNIRSHRANLLNDFVLEKGIFRMEWPACSPDMNTLGIFETF